MAGKTKSGARVPAVYRCERTIAPSLSSFSFSANTKAFPLFSTPFNMKRPFVLFPEATFRPAISPSSAHFPFCPLAGADSLFCLSPFRGPCDATAINLLASSGARARIIATKRFPCLAMASNERFCKSLFFWCEKKITLRRLLCAHSL